MQQIFFNGEIITMENETIPEAIMIDNELIKAVGSMEEIKKLANKETIWHDLSGKTMLPGFIDAHGHFIATANALLQISLIDCHSFQEVKANIEAYLKENNVLDGKWLIASGYEAENIKDTPSLSLELLDQLSPRHPLAIQHKSGHAGLFNSLALKALGISINTAAPPGGKIESLNGCLTGLLEENAYFEYINRLPMPALEELVNGYTKTQQKYASFGITTAQEGLINAQMLPLLTLLLDKNILNIDIVGYAAIEDADKTCSIFHNSIKKYDKHFKLGGYKIFLDGSPQARTAWMKEPYEAQQTLQNNQQILNEAYYGYGTMNDDAVQEAIKKAATDKMQLLAHCNGDAAIAQFITAIQNITEQGFEISKIRPVIIHAQFLQKEQLPVVKKLGLIPSFFIAHIYYWGETHIRNFGIKRASVISPAATALKQGILFTFHQDSPVIEPNMLETIWCAVNRRTKNDMQLAPNECISVYDALKAITINAAFQCFEENEKGSIYPGKKADLVILSNNPLKIRPEKIKDISILQTIKNGKTIFKA